MQLTWLDWLYIALYFALNGAIGLYYRSRAGKNAYARDREKSH